MRFPQIFKAKETDEEKKGRPIQVGEYFPWKGFMFQITEVTKEGFTAKVSGVTRKLAHLVKKEN